MLQSAQLARNRATHEPVEERKWDSYVMVRRPESVPCLNHTVRTFWCQENIREHPSEDLQLLSLLRREVRLKMEIGT